MIIIDKRKASMRRRLDEIAVEMKKLEEAKNQSIVAREQLFPLLFFVWDETWEYLSKNGLPK